MPPFSPYTEQHVPQYSDRRANNTLDERRFIGPTRIENDDEALSLVDSDFASKWSGRTAQHHLHLYNFLKDDLEEKDETEPIALSHANEEGEETNRYILSPRLSMGNGNAKLFVIPERRVSFAGKIHRGTLLDDLDVLLIPHVKEYTLEDKRNMWYTRSDLKAMRKANFHVASVVSKDYELYCPNFLRGLEHIIEEYVEYYQNENENCVNRCNNLDSCRDPSSTAWSRRWDAVEAVLFEQDKQRRISLATHGVIYKGMVNPEKIRLVYTIEGKTETSQLIALANAQRDEACAREWLMEATHAVTVNCKQESVYNCNEDHDHCRQITAISDELSRTVRWAFQRILTPVLDIPNSDIYSPMEDDYFLECK